MFASSALSSYSRLRSAYDDSDRRYPRYTPSWLSSRDAAMASGGSSTSGSSTTTPRRNRYSRASTTSVTQLLSDSCSSLLQRLNSRLRGPSATTDRAQNLSIPTTHTTGLTTPTTKSRYDPIVTSPRQRTTSNSSISSPILRNKLSSSKSSSVLSANSRHHGTATPTVGSPTPTKQTFDDKYFSVLDRIYGRRREIEKTVAPSVGRTLAKSATTSNVLLSEKAYPYVSDSSTREKTPYRSNSRWVFRDRACAISNGYFCNCEDS